MCTPKNGLILWSALGTLLASPVMDVGIARGSDFPRESGKIEKYLNSVT